jgi:hypothetical protein
VKDKNLADENWQQKALGFFNDGIERLRKRIGELEELLKKYREEKLGLERQIEGLESARALLLAQQGVATGTAQSVLSRPAASVKSQSVANLCAGILRETGKRMTSSELYAELKKRGKTFEAKNPISSTSAALGQDPRFRKEKRGLRNIWGLAEWEAKAEVGLEQGGAQH